MKRLLSLIFSVIFALIAVFAVACSNTEGGNVSIRYYATAKELMPMLISGKETIGLLPEPAATNLEKSTADKGMTWHRINVQEMYDDESKSFPQAVIMVKSDLIKAYPSLATSIANTLDDGVLWVKNNIAEAQNIIKEKFGDTTSVANMNADAVTNSNIHFSADEKESVKAYLEQIIAISPDGAKQVEDDFFYTPSEASGTFTDTIDVYAPDGAPALAIAKYIKDNENFGLSNEFNYNVVAANTLASSNGDIVIMPVNLASKIYKNQANASNPYVMLGVVTHGNLYLMSREEITIADLKDKTIGAISQGQVPDWTLQMALKKHNYIYSEID